VPQRHLDRLTPVDASFLHQEGTHSHMHIGGLTVVEGPPPSMDEFLEQIRQRLHLVPRYRHKLAWTALDSGRPVWISCAR
jgi:diacylglycerol O-acyltransferase